MANCVRCGRELPSFTFGEASNLCSNCQQTAADPRLQAASPQPILAAKPPTYRPPVTVALVGLNVLVYVAMVATGVPVENPTNFDLVKWGADIGFLSLGTQPWRVLTSNYVHVGIIHLAVNMWGLWQVGRLAERIFGKWTYLIIYTACGIAGSLASLFWEPVRVSAGASGALFGIVGALIGALYLGKLPFPKAALQGLLKNLLVVVGINLYLGAVIPAIDNAGHIGGLLMGLALGAVVGPQLMEAPDRRRSHERLVFVATAVLLVGFGIFVRHKNGYVAALGTGASDNDRLDQAIARLQRALQDNPKNKSALSMLGAAYLSKKDYPKAQATLERLLQIDPGNVTAKYDLGLTYAGLGRYEDARKIYADLVQQDPENDDAWMLLGASLEGVGREQEAVNAFQKAVAINPKNAEAFHELGLAQMKLNQPGAAIASLQRSAQLAPDNPETQRDLAQVYAAMGKSSEAAAAQQKADRLHKPATKQPATTHP